jgi:hypothetical protein
MGNRECSAILRGRLRWRRRRLGRLGMIKPRRPLQSEPKLPRAADCFSQIRRVSPEPAGELSDANFARFRLRECAKVGGRGVPVGPFGA